MRSIIPAREAVASLIVAREPQIAEGFEPVSYAPRISFNPSMTLVTSMGVMRAKRLPIRHRMVAPALSPELGRLARRQRHREQLRAAHDRQLQFSAGWHATQGPV